MDKQLFIYAQNWFDRHGYNAAVDEDCENMYVFLESIDDMNVSVQISQEEVEYRAELWLELLDREDNIEDEVD